MQKISPIWKYGVLGLVLVFILHSIGLIEVNFLPKAKHEAKIAATGPARVTVLKAVVMNDVAIEIGTVGVKLVAKSKLFGWTYNTDKYVLHAKADVGLSIKNPKDAVYDKACNCYPVTVDGSQVVFYRPRVDMAALENSLSINKGWWHRQMDSLSFSGNQDGKPVLGLEAFAQGVMGNQCTKAAWSIAKQAISISYQERGRLNGVDPHSVRVNFTGTPDFNQNPIQVQPPKDFKLSIEGGTCEVAPNALRSYA